MEIFELDFKITAKFTQLLYLPARCATVNPTSRPIKLAAEGAAVFQIPGK
jgi:hypothetical protein